jgi:NADH dehydrogenase
MTTTPVHRVVIIGSGFGGLFAARALRRAPVTVTVIDRTNHHLFQPLLYQVATGILSEGAIAPATRDVLRRHRNTTVELANVTGIDLDRRVVTAWRPERTIETPYDSLIVAAGSGTSYFGHPEFAQWAPGMKSIDDALELRARIFGAFEMAETEPDEAARRAWLTFVVVGGGPTGVEMAGQIAELSHRALQRNFRRIDPRQARVLLLEGGDGVLTQFGARLSAMTARDLGRLGVEVHTGAMVVGMDGETVDVRRRDGTTTTIDARTKVWAAGMTASPLGRLLADASGAETDRAGRVRVNPDCSLPGHPEVFVVGDLMTLDDLPAMAEVAMQSAVHAATLIKRRLDGDHTDRPFHYRDLGSLAAISRFRAVAKIGPVSIGGFVGWLLWLVVHLTFLTGFKNRLAALAHWGISFVGRDRTERTITFRQMVARGAIAALADRIADTASIERCTDSGAADEVDAPPADPARAAGAPGGATAEGSPLPTPGGP